MAASNTLRASAITRTHNACELNKKLHRSRQLALCLSLELLTDKQSMLPLYLPAALSYIADDLSDIQGLIKDLISG